MGAPDAVGGGVDARVDQTDARIDDAAVQPTSVRVRVNGVLGRIDDGPMAGLDVLFIAGDDTLVSEAVTDDDGVASAEMPEGGSVVVFFPAGDPMTPLAVATLGVEAGDELVFSRPFGQGPVVGTMTIVLPSQDGASYYNLRSGCGDAESATTTLILPVRGDCVVDGKVHLLASAIDGMARPFAYQEIEIDYAADGEVAVSGAWAPANELAVTVSDSAAVSQARISSRPAAEPQVYGYFIPRLIDLSTPGPHLVARTAPTVAEHVWLSLRNPLLAGAMQIRTVPVAPGTATVSIDPDDALLPWFGPATLDPETQSISVERSAGDALDQQLVFMSFAGEDLAYAIIVAPPDADPIALPTLPAFVDRLPVGSAPLVGVLGYERSDWASYADARQRGIDALSSGFDLSSAPVAARQSMSP